MVLTLLCDLIAFLMSFECSDEIKQKIKPMRCALVKSFCLLLIIIYAALGARYRQESETEIINLNFIISTFSIPTHNLYWIMYLS